MSGSKNNIILPQAKIHKLDVDASGPESGMAGAPNAHLALFALSRTLKMLGYYLTDEKSFNVISQLIVYWAHGNKYANSITIEHGWLPRWTYQLSPDGSNAFSHVAKQYHSKFRVFHSDELLDAKLANCRTVWKQLFDHSQDHHLDALPEKFILVPLQSPMSAYIQENAQRLFGHDIPRSKEGYPILAQAIVDYIEQFDLADTPVYFKQEPRDPHNLAELLTFKHPQNGLLSKDLDVSMHQIFASGKCSGLVAFNSNSVHESLAWNVPSVSIGEFLWSAKLTNKPIPVDVQVLGGDSYANPLERECIRHYLKYVFDHQWELSDFQNPLIVKELVESYGYCHPYQTRQKYAMDVIHPPESGMHMTRTPLTTRVQRTVKKQYVAVANKVYHAVHGWLDGLEDRLLRD
jgi:hypothetical protein